MKCRNCNKKTATIKGRQKLYCDTDCKDKYWAELKKKHYKPKKCTICGKIFTPRSFRHVYCSLNCKRELERTKSLRTPPLKFCEYCNKEFQPYNSLDKYCSSDCRINNKKSKRTKNWSEEKCKNIMGNKNPSFRTGNYVRGKKRTMVGERAYHRIRNEIRKKKMKEWGYLFCDNCGTNKTYQWEMHHIVYRSEKPKHKELHNPLNLIDLCMKCHNWFHIKKDRRNKLVKERGLVKLFK